jgi:hypothetical protein
MQTENAPRYGLPDVVTHQSVFEVHSHACKSECKMGHGKSGNRVYRGAQRPIKSAQTTTWSVSQCKSEERVDAN